MHKIQKKAGNRKKKKPPRVLELWARNYPVVMVSSAVWQVLALVFCMSPALMISLPMPSCISTHSLMASVSGLPGKREALLLEKSHPVLQKILPFLQEEADKIEQRRWEAWENIIWSSAS